MPNGNGGVSWSVVGVAIAIFGGVITYAVMGMQKDSAQDVAIATNKTVLKAIAKDIEEFKQRTEKWDTKLETIHRYVANTIE